MDAPLKTNKLINLNTNFCFAGGARDLAHRVERAREEITRVQPEHQEPIEIALGFGFEGRYFSFHMREDQSISEAQ